jgi:aminoglycoside phosphotransferase (APT) family kinase protein
MSSPPSSDLFADPGGQAAVAAALGVEVADLTYRALARGVTHDTLIVSVVERPVGVLRLAPSRPEVLPRLQPAEEGALFELLEGSGLPTPRALIVDRDGGRLGTPGLLMSYCEGANTLTWERMNERGGASAAEHAFATIVRLHELAVPADWPERGEPETHAERELAGTRRLLEDAGEAAPGALRDALPWLAARPPAPTGPPCIVHGDFRPANLMAADGEVTGILDWEMATTGDPLCDFGVSTMREWGVWMPDAELLARYGEARGVECDPAALAWWRALGYAKVVAFVAARTADGWQGPDIGPWVEGLERAVAEWEGAGSASGLPRSG